MRLSGDENVRPLFVSELPRHGNGAARGFLHRAGAPVAAGGGEVAAYAGHYAHPAAVDDA